MSADIVLLHSAPGSPRMLLKDAAYSKIREVLLCGESEQAYSERAPAASPGLKLSSVPASLERLRAEGSIVIAPNSDIRLPEITSREILDFYGLRMVIECHVVASLTASLTADQTGKIDAIPAEQEATAANGETLRYHQLDLDFHATLAESHGNAEQAHSRMKTHLDGERRFTLDPDRCLGTDWQRSGCDLVM